MDASSSSLVEAVCTLATDVAAAHAWLGAEHDRACERYAHALAASGIPFDLPELRALAKAVAPVRISVERATVEAQLDARLDTQSGVRVGLDLTLADPRCRPHAERGEKSRWSLYSYEHRRSTSRGRGHRLTLALSFADEPDSPDPGVNP